jgi:hypothetical protein
MTVEFLPEVVVYFEELAWILHEKGYFSEYEASWKYVYELNDDIRTNLPTMHHRNAPTYFDKYGKNMKYAVFPKNKQTAWYVFFKTYCKNGEDVFLVRYIGNNHVVAKYLNFNIYPPFNMNSS